MIEKMNIYRTHLCSDLSIDNLGDTVSISGWADTIRDHGNLIFIDLRDNYGITQCIIDKENFLLLILNQLNQNFCFLKV